jgi:hypothetical protein
MNVVGQVRSNGNIMLKLTWFQLVMYFNGSLSPVVSLHFKAGQDDGHLYIYYRRDDPFGEPATNEWE